MFVITEATITAKGFGQQLRYGNLLVKTPDGWNFETMVQGDHGDF